MIIFQIDRKVTVAKHETGEMMADGWWFQSGTSRAQGPFGGRHITEVCSLMEERRQVIIVEMMNYIPGPRREAALHCAEVIKDYVDSRRG